MCADYTTAEFYTKLGDFVDRLMEHLDPSELVERERYQINGAKWMSQFIWGHHFPLGSIATGREFADLMIEHLNRTPTHVFVTNICKWRNGVIPPENLVVEFLSRAEYVFIQQHISLDMKKPTVFPFPI